MPRKGGAEQEPINTPVVKFDPKIDDEIQVYLLPEEQAASIVFAAEEKDGKFFDQTATKITMQDLTVLNLVKKLLVQKDWFKEDIELLKNESDFSSRLMFLIGYELMTRDEILGIAGL